MANVVTVTDVGLGLITAALAASTHKYVGYGTGTTAADVEDTALETPRGEDRTSGTQSQETTTTSNDTYQIEATITCTATAAAITEVAVFSADSAGSMLLRCTHAVVNLEVGEGIAYTIEIITDQA